MTNGKKRSADRSAAVPHFPPIRSCPDATVSVFGIYFANWRPVSLIWELNPRVRQ